MMRKSAYQHVWQFLLGNLEAGIPSALLLVLDSEGSSPGRRGFKMAVSLDGEMAGSIGGGIMEHKLVELTRSVLAKGQSEIIFKRQVHTAESPVNRSGMICSGEQTVVIYPLPFSAESTIRSILGGIKLGLGVFDAGPDGISFIKIEEEQPQIDISIHSEKSWSYRESLKPLKVIHIIGGGHVGKALSRQMSWLGYQVKVYDNRPGLNTMKENSYADEKIVMDYKKIGELIHPFPGNCVVVMTFGYRDDKKVIQQLLGRNFTYLGMLGSKAKVRQLFDELEKEGFSKDLIDQVNSPAGVSVGSKTPEEIAVSIAAEIIRTVNSE